MTDEERFRKALERITLGDVPEPRGLGPGVHAGVFDAEHEQAVFARYAQHVLDGGDPEVGDGEYV